MSFIYLGKAGYRKERKQSCLVMKSRFTSRTEMTNPLQSFQLDMRCDVRVLAHHIARLLSSRNRPAEKHLLAAVRDVVGTEVAEMHPASVDVLSTRILRLVQHLLFRPRVTDQVLCVVTEGPVAARAS